MSAIALSVLPVTQKALELFLHLGYDKKAEMAIPCQKLLFYGPSGCGKTLLACAIAGVSRCIQFCNNFGYCCALGTLGGAVSWLAMQGCLCHLAALICRI
jgi:DNA polymerase III delta prime subunit